ncbi:putative NADPH-ferrihemo protein reductase [Naematelia encephala]|uniref:NADPH-dependent diflavin oxidoreductase 1 n=1 Tax=Naematelia encephala TaxID=71784 RepID=A0A1Y2AQ96_9TREE|nr:putative NADPH-ferrihemo protein reductase [Naematelia encephala]
MTVSSVASSSILSESSIELSPQHVTILYASETGNAQDTAERVGREFRRLGRQCVVLSMEMFDVFDLPDTQLLILITSTHGRGDPPPAMLPLWTALLRTSLPEDILEDVHFSLFGLGDSSYERFCYAGKMLARRLQALGANRLVEPAWGDERAPDGIEQAFLPWLKETVNTMIPHLPSLSPNFMPIDTTALPPPIFTLRSTAEEPPLHGLSISSDSPSTQAVPARAKDTTNGHSHEPSKPDDWYWTRLTRNSRVTQEGWWQDVREIELEYEDSGFEGYQPGSICNIQPKSSRAEVSEFLEMMDLSDQADVPFYVESTIPGQPLPPHLPSPSSPTTLRSLLTNHLDLRCSPRKSFFEWLRRLSTEEREQERLDEFIADPDEIHTYATRPSRTILETLADFRHIRLPCSHILEILPPLRRRQFSIASSWAGHPGRVQLLVALVEYKTNLKIPRRGLCSTWLDTLEIGTRIPIKISPPTLHFPSGISTPLILVGPGTGVAPMRSFVEERVRQGAADRTALYFGCRSKSADYYYADEWTRYREGGVKVEVAASRDSEDKVYVQHLIRKDSNLIYDWLVKRGGSIFISGSSNAMPREVREAIVWCISSSASGDMTEEQAAAYVEDMFETGRGGEESW